MKDKVVAKGCSDEVLAKEILSSTLDALNDAIHLVDSDLKILYWNKAFERWAEELKLTTDVVGKTVFEVFPFLGEEVEKEYAEVFRSGRLVIRENTFYCQGQRYVTETRKIPVFQDERVQQGVTVVRDITARTEAQDEILRLNRDLEQEVAQRTHQLQLANAELEAFASTVSHDLRSPLTTLKGFCQAFEALYGRSLDDKALGFLRRMFQAVDRMEALISDLLSLSRVNQTDLIVEEVDFSSLAKEVFSSLLPVERQGQVEFRVFDDMMHVRGDVRLLRLLLENLMTNALKFTSKVDCPVIELGSISGTENKPVFYLRDNGVGFSIKDAKKLFVPFERLHESKEYPGTGIGLATVRRIVERHGGRLWADGDVDEGATFYFTL